MRLWHWLTQDRWVIWLYAEGERSCVVSTHRTWMGAHRRVHELDRESRWRYPPIWHQIERAERPVRPGEFCIDR